MQTNINTHEYTASIGTGMSTSLLLKYLCLILFYYRVTVGQYLSVLLVINLRRRT